MYPICIPYEKWVIFQASHVTFRLEGVRSQPPLAQVQDPAALEFETYKFNLAWTKMKQVVGGGGSEVAAALLISQRMMVETPRNGPNHKNHPKHQEKTWKQSDVTFFLEWVYEFVLLFEEETPLCFFFWQVRETTWTPSRVQIFINRGGDDYHPGIRKRVSLQPWEETQQLYQS